MKSKKINKEKLRIAFDGYGASGKSLGAKLISKKYKLKLLNSGLLYRYAAFLILKKKPDKEKNRHWANSWKLNKIPVIGVLLLTIKNA